MRDVAHVQGLLEHLDPPQAASQQGQLTCHGNSTRASNRGTIPAASLLIWPQNGLRVPCPAFVPIAGHCDSDRALAISGHALIEHDEPADSNGCGCGWGSMLGPGSLAPTIHDHCKPLSCLQCAQGYRGLAMHKHPSIDHAWHARGPAEAYSPDHTAVAGA